MEVINGFFEMAKEELFTLLKRGTFHFALTSKIGSFAQKSYRYHPKTMRYYYRIQSKKDNHKITRKFYGQCLVDRIIATNTGTYFYRYH